MLALLPPVVCRRLFGPNEAGWQGEVDTELQVWEDSWMNKHLGYRIVELLMVRLIPEMAEKGPKELMEMRLGPRA